MKPIIEVDRISKLYQLGMMGASTLRESFERWWYQVRRKEMRHIVEPSDPEVSPELNTMWALKDVSFSVNQGEIVGIIGRNGAGKSTLLKVLSRITEPTSGRATMRGRVSSLLEVGTGFHPELTGMENIYLNGAILGMRKSEIDRKFDEIISFAELKKFIDTPVKHYSSGMYVRLAFAIAAHLEPEILLVDEVLAVGDYQFQEKCIGRMDTLSQKGKTVLLVTHNLQIVTKICSRAILIDQGCLSGNGSPLSIVKQYFQKDEMNVTSAWSSDNKSLVSRGIRFKNVKVCDIDGNTRDESSSDEPTFVDVAYEVYGSGVISRIILHVENERGLVVLATTDCDTKGGIDVLRSGGTHTCRCILPPHLLAPGTYYLTVMASRTNTIVWDEVPRVVKFNITRIGSLYSLDERPGLVAPILQWSHIKTCQ